jgi:hypothetical protein
VTQPLTEMSTRKDSWGWRRPVRRADNLTTYIWWLSRNSEASTSKNPKGPSRPVAGKLYFYIYNVVQIWPGLFVCKQVTVCPGHIWTTLYIYNSERGRYNSIFIATGYEMDGPRMESLWWRNFPHSFRPALGAHPASYTMGTGSPFRRWRNQGVALTTHRHLAPRSDKE